MFPSAVDYRAPTSLDEALDLLAQHGDDAKVLAGGQSLVPLLKLRLAAPGLVVDIGRIGGLDGVGTQPGGLHIGARTTHADIERAPGLRRTCALLADTAPLVSDPLVRNMGTVGGSVCHADPAGDWASVMLALNAQFTLRSKRGERTVAAADFFQGPFTTALAADELMTAISIPLPSGPASGTYLKLERKVGDFATVGVAVQLELDDGHIARAGIGLTAVGPTNLKATAAEQALAGQAPSDDAFAHAARLAAEAAEPKNDIRGSVDYKRDVVRVYVQRGLRRALAQAREGRA
jgi:carbon-monoxide dehydrogenase medium subunit